MPDPLPTVGPPELVYRVERRISGVFEPPAWRYATEENKTFGGRFDDPSAARGVPQEERYRVIYCATRSAGAFGETTAARFRPNTRLPPELREEVVPEDRGGVAPKDWRMNRRISFTRLARRLLFVDVVAPETLRELREDLGRPDLDLGVVFGQDYSSTRQIAKYIHELSNSSGQPAYAGVRYLSRWNLDWELWAVFDDRMCHEPAGPVEPIPPDDPGLVEAADLLGIRIGETDGP